MRCDHLEPMMEAIADGSLDLAGEDRAHLESCERCRARLAEARAIEQWLTSRDVAAPPAAFTTAVMSRIVSEKWKAERVIDVGFNLAVAAGLLVILAGAAGLAWSLGFLTITIDLAAILAVADTEVTGRVISQIQTVAISAALLTMALVLWWWAEAARD